MRRGKRAHHDGSDPRYGRRKNRCFKPAGGVRTAEDAQKYLAIQMNCSVLTGLMRVTTALVLPLAGKPAESSGPRRR